jgi:hypothetical protein
MYIKTTNGQIDKFPYTVGQLRRDHPNVSFPKQIPADDLAAFGVYTVDAVAPPAYDSRTQSIGQDQPTLTDGKWAVGWTVTDKTSEELAQQDAEQAKTVRADRNTKLAATDWTQGKDIPDNVSSTWAAYRQALRDVPAQAGFPWEVTWPTQPE